MKVVSCQSYEPAAFIHRNIPVLIFRGWVDPRAHGTVGCHGKIPAAPGIDPEIFRLVAQCRNHYATPGPIINAWSNYISNKGAPEECDKEENVQELRLLMLPVWNEDFKRPVHCHIFAQSQPARRPTNKYPVNTSHLSDLCKNVSLQCYLVATVIHIQSLCSRIYRRIPYPRVIRSKTYRGYVKPRIILNAIYNMIRYACNIHKYGKI
jgi:hypothetical protein